MTTDHIGGAVVCSTRIVFIVLVYVLILDMGTSVARRVQPCEGVGSPLGPDLATLTPSRAEVIMERCLSAQIVRTKM